MIYMALEILICVFALTIFATMAFIVCSTILLAREALLRVSRAILKLRHVAFKTLRARNPGYHDTPHTGPLAVRLDQPQPSRLASGTHSAKISRDTCATAEDLMSGPQNSDLRPIPQIALLGSFSSARQQSCK
jgi:hypothetical protein